MPVAGEMGLGRVLLAPREEDLRAAAVWVFLCPTRSNSNALAHDRTVLVVVVVGTPDLPLEPAEAEGDRV